MVRNFKILSDKLNVYIIHSCEWNCSKKVKNNRNINDGYRRMGQLSLCSRKASFEFWLGLFSVFIFCAVERGSPHLRMCLRYQGKVTDYILWGFENFIVCGNLCVFTLLWIYETSHCFMGRTETVRHAFCCLKVLLNENNFDGLWTRFCTKVT
jgi:hypothetical protein